MHPVRNLHFVQTYKVPRANMQFQFAQMYAKGEGTMLVYKEAAKWNRLSAQQGHIKAYFQLGILYKKARCCIKLYRIHSWAKKSILKRLKKQDKESTF
jgi:uncharacterized protein